MTFKLFDLFGFGVVVFDRHVSDGTCFGRVLQGAPVFCEELAGGMQTSNHAGEGVSTDALPEQASQLTVSIWHIDSTRVLLSSSQVIKSSDDLPEREKRLVDLYTFLLRLTFSLSDVLALTTCQVDQLHLADDGVVRVVSVGLFEGHGKDGVGSGGGQVHLVGANDFVPQAVVEETQNFVIRVALEGEQVLHCVNVEGVPLQFQTS